MIRSDGIWKLVVISLPMFSSSGGFIRSHFGHRKSQLSVEPTFIVEHIHLQTSGARRANRMYFDAAPSLTRNRSHSKAS